MSLHLENTGLVLEGGGLRGVYTSGVLQAFMEQNLYIPYVIGVSMGACNAANYVSRQIKRNRIVNIEYVNDPRYLSYLRLLTKGELFGMDFIFKTIPDELVPFDYETFLNSSQRNIAVVADCVTGEALYLDSKEIGKDYLYILRAASSLPLVQKPVRYNGRLLLDGGLVDSIPIRKSLADGNVKNIVILTQPADFRKQPQSLQWFIRMKYPQFTGLQKAIAERHVIYNETLDFIKQLEATGSVFVIQPDEKLPVGRVERDKSKLYNVYDVGYRDAKKKMSALLEFLSANGK
jgi:predicted patatin/cPLA2 family phospholipase